jgi:hypothetical protein
MANFDDDRAPYISTHVYTTAMYNQYEYVPIVPIIREMYKEDREKMYVATSNSPSSVAASDYNQSWNDLYYEYSDEECASTNGGKEEVESVKEEGNEEQEDEDFDPLTNDPLFRSVAQKFAYV